MRLSSCPLCGKRVKTYAFVYRNALGLMHEDGGAHVIAIGKRVRVVPKYAPPREGTLAAARKESLSLATEGGEERIEYWRLVRIEALE